MEFMSEETLIRLLESQKRDIITVINAKTDSISDHVTQVENRVITQNSRIGKLEDKVGAIRETCATRGGSCLQEIESLKPLEKTVKMMNFFASHKVILITGSLFGMIIIQTLVYLVFRYEGLLDIFKLIYK